MAGLLIVTLFGLMFPHVIYMAAVVNYAMQSEVLIDFMNSIIKFIEEQLLKQDKPDQINNQSEKTKVCIKFGY